MGHIADTRRNIQAILQTIPSLTVVLGTKHLGNQEDFFKSLYDFGNNSSKPCAVVVPGRFTKIENFLKTTEFEVDIRLYYGFKNHEDFDYTEIEDLVEDIMTKLRDGENWTAARPYDGTPLEKQDEELHQQPVVVCYEGKLLFKAS